MVDGEKLPYSRYGSAQFRDDKLLEPITRSVVDLVALAEVAYSDCDVGHAYLLLSWQSLLVTVSSIGTSSSAHIIGFA